MKLALISDTHGMLPSINDFDGASAVIHAGDIGPDHGVREWIRNIYIPWQEELQAKGIPVYATLGNHDFPDKWGDVDGILIDTSVKIKDLNVWFSPWSVKFYDWAWMRNEQDLTEIYNNIPVDTDIIVSHTPPYKIRDSYGDKYCGSKALRVRMQEIPTLKWLICGHIHEARGTTKFNNICVMNVASVDEMYHPLEERITWLEI